LRSSSSRLRLGLRLGAFALFLLAASPFFSLAPFAFFLVSLALGSASRRLLLLPASTLLFFPRTLRFGFESGALLCLSSFPLLFLAFALGLGLEPSLPLLVR
jgi:hypothetical protein